MKETSKKKASLLNMMFMSLYQIMTALFGFILPSMIMHSYGADLHGYTTTVSTIMSYIALINAGLAPAAIQALYAPLAKKDRHRINEVLNAVNRFYVISGCLYSIVVLVIAVILPFVISNQLPSNLVMALMIVIGASNTLECFIYSKYKVLLQADQKLYVVAIADTIVYLIRVLLQITLILLNKSIILVMIVPAIMVILRMGILYVFCKKNYDTFDKTVKPDYSALSKRWAAMVHQISTLVVNNTDVVLLTIFGNLVQVSVYSVYNLVFSNISNLFNNVFSNGTVASFGRLFHEGKREALNKAYDLYEFGYYMIVSFVYGVAISLILPFISVYTLGMKNIPYYDVWLAILFIVIGLANHIRMPDVTLITAAGHYRETQGRAILEAIINLVISTSLVKPLGMYGLLIGTICSYSYRTIDSIVYTHKYILYTSIKSTCLRVARVIATVCISAGIYRIFFNVYRVSSWLSWFKYAILASATTAVVCLSLCFISEPHTFGYCINSIIGKRKD